MTTPIPPCIWCCEPVSSPTLEHILPDSLGCPEWFVLENGACAACNNGLGHVDQALLRQFEIIAFVHGVHRKDGRPPSIDTWASLKARVGTDGPELHLNAGPQVVETMGKQLPAANRSNGIFDVRMERDGNKANIGFRQEFGRDPKFARALYKVGLGSFAFFHGVQAATDPRFDPVRAFVKDGIGDFQVLMLGRQDEPVHQFGPAVSHPDCPFPMVGLTIFGVHFILDLDPDQRGMAHMRATLPSATDERWMILPKAA